MTPCAEYFFVEQLRKDVPRDSCHILSARHVGYQKHAHLDLRLQQQEKKKGSHNFAKTPLKAAQAPLDTASTIHMGCRRQVASMEDRSIVSAPVCTLVASFASRSRERTGEEGGTFTLAVPDFSRLLPLPRCCRCRACDIA